MAQTQPQKTNTVAPVSKPSGNLIPQTSASASVAQQNSTPTTPVLEEKKFYQKWWFLAILGVVLLGMIGLFIYLIF